MKPRGSAPAPRGDRPTTSFGGARKVAVAGAARRAPAVHARRALGWRRAAGVSARARGPGALGWCHADADWAPGRDRGELGWRRADPVWAPGRHRGELAWRPVDAVWALGTSRGVPAVARPRIPARSDHSWR